MDVSKVDNLLAEMRAVMAVAQGKTLSPAQATKPAGGVDFSSALKASIDGVAQMQNQAEAMQKSFVMGDDKVSLSDTMISMQKANIAFQTTIQVRNKVVAAYNDIMNMQV
jgi:flagellar hook-basal body complex protein FliE